MGNMFSPEEKLLKLIRGDKPKNRPAGPRQYPVSDIVKDTQTVSMTYAKAVPAGLSNDSKRYDYLRLLNSVLAAAALLGAAYFIYDFNRNLSIRPPDYTGEAAAHIKKPASAESLDSRRQSFSYFTTAISGRQLFKPVMASQEQGHNKNTQSEDIIGNLSLIGIVAGSDPQAIIEDKKNQKTYFLYKGQSFNQMELEEITENKVILTLNGNKYELTL